MTAKRFRIALSFAGEKRDFVAQIAAVLAQRFGEAAILYDKFHEAEFARYDLGIYLPKLYSEQSDLVVPVLCHNYDQKRWTGWEWIHIYALMTKSGSHQVMPCRFDHATADGLSPVAGFIELDHKTPEQTATLILERLALNEGHAKDYYTAAANSSLQSSKISIPNNLPRLQCFFGREKELKTIADALLPEARTWGALIDGPGGIGKTALAIRAAELALNGPFQRILFLSAKEREMSADGARKLSGFVLPGYLEMLNEIARQLHQADLLKQPEPERARLILEALGPENALLILDNLESLLPEHRDLLFTFLSRIPQGCKAIVTSRRRTDVDARIIRLGKLDQQAALLFLAQLAESRPLLANTIEIERIHLYEETGGNPLLLRWIAGQLGKGHCRTIAGALAFLRSMPKDNDPLEFIFGDLLETFTESETKVLAALTHFTIAMPVMFIAELANITRTAAKTALLDLTNRALVMSDEAEESFVLVPMVADFLRQKRPESVQQTGTYLVKRSYAHIVQYGYMKNAPFDMLDAIWPSVAPALPLFINEPNDQLQTVCEALKYFLDFTGRWDEGLSLSLNAERKALALHDFYNAGWRANDAGWSYYHRGQPQEVLACAGRAASHWGGLKAGVRERTIAIRLRGAGHLLASDHTAAIAAFGEAVDAWRAVAPSSIDVALCLDSLATAKRLSGKLDSAERDYREALRMAQTAGDDLCVANFTGNLVDIAIDRKDWITAQSAAERSLHLSEQLGRKELIAVNCFRIAQSMTRQGNIAAALPHAIRATRIFSNLRSPYLPKALEVLAECQA